MSEFEIFKNEQTGWPDDAPEAPPWRRFRHESADGENSQEYRGKTYESKSDDLLAVNCAIHLRRPLLLTGDPGSGKSSLAYAIAYRLNLGEVLYWSINSQTTIKDGLYQYDAISRLRDANLKDKIGHKAEPEQIGNYLSLGPLGTALAPRQSGDRRPRILLIDELDKCDVDLPNDLLDTFEEGSFIINELVRIKEQQPKVHLKTAYRLTNEREETIEVTDGHVPCQEFPIVIITSNEERQFPPAFLRRCLRHDISDADEQQLKQIVKRHDLEDVDDQVKQFAKDRQEGKLNSNDQLLNALFLLNKTDHAQIEELRKLVLRDLKE